MTREEAKQWIEWIKRKYVHGGDEEFDYKRKTALDMAIKALEQKPKTGHSFPEGATNKDIFKAIFGYEPATDSVVCNKEDWCGASEPCNYCLNNSDSIGREEDWWNAPYKPEGGKR